MRKEFSINNDKVLINFNAENLQIIGDYFLTNNTTIENINLPNIKIKKSFYNKKIKHLKFFNNNF